MGSMASSTTNTLDRVRSGRTFASSSTTTPTNLDRRGENELLVANYTMGIRLVDTSDKANPVESAFFLPNGSRADACKHNECFISRQRMVWGAYFGTDGRIYASDMVLGLYVVQP